MSQRLQNICFLLILAASIACGVIFIGRLGTDFWPPDRSTIGPNLIASLLWIIPSFGAGLLAGRRLHARHDKHDAELAALRQHMSRLTEHLEHKA